MFVLRNLYNLLLGERREKGKEEQLEPFNLIIHGQQQPDEVLLQVSQLNAHACRSWPVQHTSCSAVAGIKQATMAVRAINVCSKLIVSCLAVYSWNNLHSFTS
jgi:hypothetical protein